MKRSLLAAALAVVLAPSAVEAFCGFYVSGADAKLYNNATMVVLMREGTRTVLSMQNNYQGPPEDFAMVVPVPVVLKEENVKTLPPEIFDRVDALAAPRLVEYWEQDPCEQRYRQLERSKMARAAGVPTPDPASAPRGDLGVKIEAQFTVGEYNVVVLSAQDSTGLDTWLRREKYNIPEGAEPILKPYVQSGMKFFVAKVDVEKVKFNGNQAMLSPLRFHYDSEKFELPVRLGLVNSQGVQDLLVHIVAAKRYEVANYPNVTIPTNIIVDDLAKDRFGEFYVALLDETLAKNPGAVVTEYSWDPGSCDPCPTPPLDHGELMTLGQDVLPDAGGGAGEMSGPPRRMRSSGMVLTRLHARYTRDSLGEDLVFKEADGIIGGRGTPDQKGELREKGATPQPGWNNFQGRYVILHPWEGEIACKEPLRGIWGGNPAGGGFQPRAATDSAFAPRGQVQLTSFLAQDVPELALKAGAGSRAKARMKDDKRGDWKSNEWDGGKSCGCATGAGRSGVPSGLGLLGVLGAAGLFLIRTRREGW